MTTAAAPILFNREQLFSLVKSSYAYMDEERVNRVFEWIANAEVRASLCTFAADAISSATQEAVKNAVARCMDEVVLSVNFGQYAAQIHLNDPAIAQRLSPHDVLYAFRSLLNEQDFILDEHGVLNLTIPISLGADLPDEPPPPPAPIPEDPPAEVNDTHRAILGKTIRDLTKEINKGEHDGILPNLLCAENERETPRTSIQATLRTRLAWVRDNP